MTVTPLQANRSTTAFVIRTLAFYNRSRLVWDFRYPTPCGRHAEDALAWLRSWLKPAGTWTFENYPTDVYPNGDVIAILDRLGAARIVPSTP